MCGGIVAVYDQVNIRNSIIYGNDVGSLCTIQGGSFDVSYSNIEGGFEGESNIILTHSFVTLMEMISPWLKIH